MIQVHNYFRGVTLRSRCQQWSLEWHNKRKNIFLCCTFHLKSTFLWQCSASVSSIQRTWSWTQSSHCCLGLVPMYPFQDSVFLEQQLMLNSWRCILFPSEKGILLWFSLIDTGVVCMSSKQQVSVKNVFQPMLMKNYGISVIASKYPTTMKNMEGKPEGILRK